MERLIELIEGGWKPWDYWDTDKKNWILVYGGYGYHNLLMNGDYDTEMTSWPENSGKDDGPVYDSQNGEFDVEKYIRLTGRAVHSQEGPGLYITKRPVVEPQRSFLTGLINLYNDKKNGFAFHSFPISLTDSKDEILRDILKDAFLGIAVE
jgi:hypothetical protein